MALAFFPTKYSLTLAFGFPSEARQAAIQAQIAHLGCPSLSVLASFSATILALLQVFALICLPLADVIKDSSLTLIHGHFSALNFDSTKSAWLRGSNSLSFLEP